MKKTPLLVACMTVLLGAGCQNSSNNNQLLEYETIDVNFKAVISDFSWLEDAEIGIFSSCTRNDIPNASMSTNANAKYIVAEAGESVILKKASDEDVIEANYTDHNFKFYAYYPYSASSADITSIPVQVPAEQLYAKGVMAYSTFTATKSVTTVVPAAELAFQSVFSIVELHLPNNLLASIGSSVIKSLTLKPADATSFNNKLAVSGTYNIETDTFTADTSVGSDEITVDFGENGLALIENSTKIAVVVAPFTVPEGGMELVVTNIDEQEISVSILDQDKDKGTVLAAGELMSVYVSGGMVPVTFPVVFPMGHDGTSYIFSSTTQPRWVSEGYWSCQAQPQAYATWNKVSDPSPDYSQQLLYTNSGSDIGSPGIRGIWTGDYFEFVLPVSNFAANTSVTIYFSMYTRQGPVFWYIKYLDGEEWKCNMSEITCYDPLYKMDATYSLIRGYVEITHTMTFTEEIESGHVKIRLECADGTIQANAATTVIERDIPYTDANGYGAPFYFFKTGDKTTEVSFSIN